MSADEIREVSSCTASIPVAVAIRSDRPRALPCRRTRLAIWSSSVRRIPASSRVALKYPTRVRYGSAAAPCWSNSVCPAMSRISADFNRVPCAHSPR